MSRLSIVTILCAVLGCSSSDGEAPAAPTTTCVRAKDTQVCKCAASPGEGTQVPSCTETTFTAKALCCADDEKGECSCLGYSCSNGECKWGMPFGTLTVTGMYCCADSSAYGDHYGSCRCAQYEPCLERETPVPDCSPDTMPRVCAQGLRQVESCQPK